MYRETSISEPFGLLAIQVNRGSTYLKYTELKKIYEYRDFLPPPPLGRVSALVAGPNYLSGIHKAKILRMWGHRRG